MELTPGQKEACKRLKDTLAELPTGGVHEVIMLDDDLFDDSELEDLEDLEGEDEILELEEGKCMETPPSPSNLVENSVQRCILDLLISLFTHLPSGSDKFYSPIHRWSRPRSLELVAGSGKRSDSDDVYDVHGNLSKGRSRARGADHPITPVPRPFLIKSKWTMARWTSHYTTVFSIVILWPSSCNGIDASPCHRK